MKKVNVNGDIFYFNLNATANQICEYLYEIRFELPYFNEIDSCDFDVMGTDVIEIKGDEDYFEFFIETIVPIF